MCITPYTLHKEKMTVPCGKCLECLGRRRNQWIFRLWHEMQVSQTAAFFTFTYDDDHVPITEKGYLTLRYSDFQKAIKRLREAQKKYIRKTTGIKFKDQQPIKYYACGEYGTNTKRPHYHAIIFNVDMNYITKSLDFAQSIWQNGNVDIAVSNVETISYTCGYMMKGRWKPDNENDDRIPEMSRMSKGMGMSYLTPAKWEMHVDRLDSTVSHPSGWTMAMPRYFRDKVFSEEERKELNEINQTIHKVNLRTITQEMILKNREITKDKIRKYQKTLILNRQKL